MEFRSRSPRGELDDLAGQREGQRQRGLEGLAPGQRVHRAAGRGVLVVDDDQVVAVVPVQLVLPAGQLHERGRGLGHQRVQRLAAQPALEVIRAEQLAQLGQRPARPRGGPGSARRAWRASARSRRTRSRSHSAPGEVAGQLARRLGRVGHPGDAVLGQQAGQRGRAGGDPLPQGRGRGFEIREALAALGVCSRGPAGQRFPGGGQAALLDGGGAETDHRVAGPAQVGPGRGLVVGEVLAGPLRRRRVPALGRAASRAWARASSARVDRVERRWPRDFGPAGAPASAAANLAELPLGGLHGAPAAAAARLATAVVARLPCRVERRRSRSSPRS